MIEKELSITLKALAGAGAFILGNVVAGVCICKKNMKEIAKAENQNNYSYTGIFQKLRLNISANVDNAYIASLSGAADIVIPYPEKDRIYVELTSAFSKITVFLPENVRFVCNDFCGKKTLVEEASSQSEEALPEIHLVMKCRFSKVNFIRTQGEAVRVTGA